ncbi:MAG: MiaB/RimO family radical SAM methylthiotransferase [Candidatus Falkowbacteria bacterium]
MKYHIITLGCQMNQADSERLAGYYKARGFNLAKNEKEADIIIINTCMVKQAVENRLYSMVHNLKKNNPPHHKRAGQARPKIIVTGCFVGAMEREPSGQMKKYMKNRLPGVDEFLSMDEVGFSAHLATLGSGPTQSAKADMSWEPLRKDKKSALLPISNGCNNMCSYCIVPHARGREVSRPFEEIVNEAEDLAKSGYSEITLLGQNVNSYGADLADQLTFPNLLKRIAQIKGLNKINFMSSNPWDFSDELIEIIARNKNINREIHLPVQSGDDEILKK